MTTSGDLRLSGGLQDERHERIERLTEAKRMLHQSHSALLRAREAGWKDKGHDLSVVEDAICALARDIEAIRDELEGEAHERP